MTAAVEHDLIVGGIPLVIAIGGWVVTWRGNVARAHADRAGIRREFYGLLHRFAYHVAYVRTNGFGEMAELHEVFALVKERAKDSTVMAALPSDASARLVQVLIDTASTNLRTFASVSKSWERRSPQNQNSTHLFYEEMRTQLSACVSPTCPVLHELFEAIRATEDIIILTDAERAAKERMKAFAAQIDAQKRASTLDD